VTACFYVDESGHTGANLFDDAQPMLYCGVLSSKLNVDLVAEAGVACLRLGVQRHHANELGNGPLVSITRELCRVQKSIDFRFDLYRVVKPDHAIICFFDQVFDSCLRNEYGGGRLFSLLKWTKAVFLAKVMIPYFP